MKANRVRLGSKYRDTISGWEGVAECKTEWLNGCVRVGLAAADKDGAPVNHVFDVEQIEPVKIAPVVKPTRTGGGRDDATRPSDPSR